MFFAAAVSMATGAKMTGRTMLGTKCPTAVAAIKIAARAPNGCAPMMFCVRGSRDRPRVSIVEKRTSLRAAAVTMSFSGSPSSPVKTCVFELSRRYAALCVMRSRSR